MTVVGAGGVVITDLRFTKRFQRDYRKLTPELQERTHEKLNDLKRNPRPAGLRFEKLKGCQRPDIFTIHITGNIKLSFEIEGTVATLRRIAVHDEIDLSP